MIELERKRDLILSALRVSEGYIISVLVDFDDYHDRCASFDAERKVIVDDLTCLREAIKAIKKIKLINKDE